jgi:hypothetical protein
MAIVVVGGHSRKVGKTSVVSALIRDLSGYHWTAIKISPHAHGPAAGYGRDSIIMEESAFPYRFARWLHCGWVAPKPASDTSRFLAAGSSRAVLVSPREGDLSSAVEQLSPIIRASSFTIIESNSILRFLKPDFCLLVLKTDIEEFKDSAREMLARADAALIVDCGGSPPVWRELFRGEARGIAQFTTRDPHQIPRELVDIIKSRIGKSRSLSEK